jgi:hypothetical protein
MTDKASGLSVAAPVWKDFMLKALPEFPEEEFLPPDPVFSDKPMLNGNFIYDPGDTPQIHNILFYVDKNSPLGPFPSNPFDDNQYKNWEESVSTWAIGRFISDSD